MLKQLMAMLATGLCIVTTHALAQDNYTISGRVQDSARHPLDMATAVLRSLPDSAVVKGTYSDSTGRFLLDHLKGGNYFVELSAQGYTTWQSSSLATGSDNAAVVLPVATLQTLAKGLKEVAITARKSFVVQKQDRTVVNVDAMLTSAGSTALEVLEKCPGVQVSQEGAISLKGKQGVTVFINDKPSYLSGNDLANYLKSLPSSALDQIELMTNPPAQYDAAGNAGIINIKIKRKGAKGFNGGINLGVGQGQLTRSNNNINLNYRNNKVSTYINVGYNFGNDFSDLNLNRVYLDAANNPTTYFNQRSYNRHGNKAGFLNAGADYSYSDKTVFGITVSGMARRSQSTNDNTSSLYDATHQPDSSIISQNKNNTHFKNGAVNLNYRTQFSKSGHELTADADYVGYNTATDQVFHNDGYLPDGTPQSKDVLTGNLPNSINIYALKTDYTLPLSKKWKFASGLKTSFTNTNNKADYLTTANNVTAPDYDKSNHFLYKENINAAYINLNMDGKRFSAQGGLRLENTVSEGHQLGNAIKPDSAFTRNYTNLFPTVFLSYKFDTMDKHVLNLNYGRRIDRPYYEDLNPFVSPIDKFTYYVGNPFLKPSFNNSITLSHMYKSKVTTSIMYSKSADDVNETIEINNGIYYSRSGNIGRKTNITLSVDGDFDPAKWLNIHVYTEYGYIETHSDFYTGTLSTSGAYWYFGPTFRAKAGKGWDIELNGNYRTKIYDAQFTLGEIWGANIAAQKKLSDACTLKLGMRDIFYSQIAVGEIGNLSHATANWTNKHDSRSGNITFSYRFGKAFNNTAKHNETSADAEKNRVKG